MEIKAEFGPEVFSPDGQSIDRDALRKAVLEDEVKLRRLNAITHPHIRNRMMWEVLALTASGHHFAVLDAPLLFESGGKMINYLHKIMVVVCEPDLQIQRLMENRQLSEHESTLLIRAQMPLEAKAQRADFVLENSGNLQDLRSQVETIFRQLVEDKFHWKIRLGIGLAFGGLVGLLYLMAKTCCYCSQMSLATRILN